MAKFTRNTKKGPVPHKVLSERGIHLEQAHQRQQGINIHTGKTVVIGQNDNGEDITVQIGHRCPKCRKRVRGLNHAEGAHHNGGVTR